MRRMRASSRNFLSFSPFFVFGRLRAKRVGGRPVAKALRKTEELIEREFTTEEKHALLYLTQGSDSARAVHGFSDEKSKWSVLIATRLAFEARGFKVIGVSGAARAPETEDVSGRFDPALKVGARVSKAARDRGLIARAMPHGDILGFAPPLVMTEPEIDEMVGIALAAVQQVMAELPAA